jgi:hypothetical protein
LAERYLREVRGIHCPLPATLAYLAPTRSGHHPALVAAYGMPDELEPGILAEPENVDAVHLVLLKSDGSGKANVKPNKVTVGSPAGQPIVLAPLNDLLGLAITEGVEDALSVHAASGLGAWAAGGASHMPKLAGAVPDYIDWFRIIADGNETGYRNAFELSCSVDFKATSLTSRHWDFLMQPNKTLLLRNQSRAFHSAGYKSKPRDANDILRTNGTSALRRALDGATSITLPTAGTRKSGEVTHEEAWKNPDWTLLEDRRGELPEFPIDVLDPASRNFIKRASHGAGVTHAHVAVPLLSVVSGQIGTARRVAAARSWSEPASIWTSIVGFSGTGKTPGLDVPKRHLAEVERGRRDKIAELQRDHETRKESAQAATVSEGSELAKLVDTYVRAVEASDLDKRLRAIEEKMAK